jgi:ribose 5-phosphate isomerase A
MIVGLGTGSTAAYFVRMLGDSIRAGLDVAGVATSIATERLAQEVGVPLLNPDAVAHISLTVDGADEFDPELRLIKGGGAALLREKIIADSSDQMVVISDSSKAVDRLGRFPLPIEINPFAAELTRRRVMEVASMADIPAAVSRWRDADGQRAVTDGGHFILDLHCGEIPDAELLADLLDKVPGVVEHGLFIGFAHLAIVGDARGVRRIEPSHEG